MVLWKPTVHFKYRISCGKPVVLLQFWEADLEYTGELCYLYDDGSEDGVWTYGEWREIRRGEVF